MSLQGTLDTFSLDEILELVQRSRKTGALEVRDPQSRGVLYFAGGRFNAAEAGDLNGPVDSVGELESRLVDVCFSLFRIETGLFEFENDRFPPWPVRGETEIAPVVEQVQRLCREWQAIEAIVPSLDCCPEVVDDLDGDRLVLDRAGFRVLRAIDGERNVTAIARSVGVGVLEVGTVLKELVEAGAVTVTTAPARTRLDDLVVLPDADERPMGTECASEGVPDLQVMHGLLVPSSPEGLVDTERPTAAEGPSIEHLGGPAPVRPRRASVTETHETAARREAIGIDEAIDAGDHIVGGGIPGGVHHQEGADESTVPAPEQAEDDADDEPAPDRGALLRLFSSLRDP